MEIYRINHICLNQLKTQFCLSYNKGIKIYNLKNLNQIGSSNSNNFMLVKIKIILNRVTYFAVLCFMN